MKKSALGNFYPTEKSELENLIKGFNTKEPQYFSRAVIVPHAGYKYCGKLIAKGLIHINPTVKNIFIFAPSHYERIFGCVTPNCHTFETPFGEITTNKELLKELSKVCDCEINNFAFKNEHSIDTILPLLKYYLPDVKIIPVLYGCENFKNLSEVIQKYFENKENAFIISSDLSHFYPEKEAVNIDNYTARMIEEQNISNFDNEQACGAVGICSLVEFALKNNFSLIRAGLTNSSASNGDSSRVVGYGCWFLYEGDKNKYIKNYYSKYVLKICRKSIQSGFQLGQNYLGKYDCVFEQFGASFVTIKLEGILRGCVGSVMPYQSLVKDLIKNSHAAAFSDSRFPGLTFDEFNKVKIKVSLLSKPKRLIFDTEEDLLKQMNSIQEGLLIRDGLKKAVFLPDVWEQIPERKEFLNQLKLKAGFKSDEFPETLEAFVFNVVSIE